MTYNVDELNPRTLHDLKHLATQLLSPVCTGSAQLSSRLQEQPNGTVTLELSINLRSREAEVLSKSLYLERLTRWSEEIPVAEDYGVLVRIRNANCAEFRIMPPLDDMPHQVHDWKPPGGHIYSDGLIKWTPILCCEGVSGADRQLALQKACAEKAKEVALRMLEELAERDTKRGRT